MTALQRNAASLVGVRAVHPPGTDAWRHGERGLLLSRFILLWFHAWIAPRSVDLEHLGV